ncbi:MAG TPA: ComF family protein [Bacteroidetes bacterium]|nr:ComF family protein [Bacteroidota bacterium]
MSFLKFLKFKAYFKDLIDLIFPRFCIICQKQLLQNENPWCLNCNLKLAKKTFVNWDHNSLTDLFWGRVPLKHAASFFIYKKNTLVQECIYDFKYFSKLSMGKKLSSIAAISYKEKIASLSIDMIVPVPLSNKKYKKRGFNQSEIIANVLGENWHIPVIKDMLLKVKEKPSQTGLDKWSRWENSKNSFTLANNHDFKDMHILLVDDIITSGATIEAIALPLTKVPGIKLSVFSLAFASE